MGLLPPAPPPELGVSKPGHGGGQGRPSPASSSFPFLPHLSITTPAAKPRDEPIPGCEREDGGLGGGRRRFARPPRRARGEWSIFRARPSEGVLSGRVGPRTRRLQGPTASPGARLPGDRAVDLRAESQRQGSLRARRTHHGLPQRGHPTVRVQCRLRAPCPHAWVRPARPGQTRGSEPWGVGVGGGGAGNLSLHKTLLGPGNSAPAPWGWKEPRNQCLAWLGGLPGRGRRSL